jgi:hypothetical protein
MISNQNSKNSSNMSPQELQEVRNMARKLRQLKRQMFLKQVEAPTPVDSFRSLIMGLAVEEEAREACRSRSNSFSSEGRSSRSSSFDISCTSFNDSLRSIGDLYQIEE